ncbi:MAG: CBS domain-containing protein [Bacteroidota bacterium]
MKDPAQSTQRRNTFIKGLLDDVNAMDYMIEHDWFECDDMRIGAEQEVVLVDRQTFRPSAIGPEVLREMGQYEWLVGELSKFNLEINLAPRVYGGDSLSAMEQELSTNLGILKSHLQKSGVDYVLTGILPTLQKFHLSLDNLTPNQRYIDLMKALHGELKEKSFELRLVGIDELLVRHDSPLLEACNTSFQVHLQVTPEHFVRDYNYALALTAPCIGMSANSAMLFGKRLWHETRIALFQQAIDTRKILHHMRQMSPRVVLGDDWLDRSVTDIWKSDIGRFRVLMTSEVSEDSMHQVRRKKVPKLKCLQLNNSTVYRWNRPCYGISGTGKPHLRIENRVFPSGPTVLDEMSNAAFWLGAVRGMPDYYGDIRDFMSFADVRDNFAKAARFGIDTKLTWTKDRKITMRDLMLEELIPMAEAGLHRMQIDQNDIDRYMGVIKERINKHMNGARWMLRSYTALCKRASSTDEALATLTGAIYKNQNRSNCPVHEWPEASLDDLGIYRPEDMRVSEFMQTEILTAHKTDLALLAARLMKWHQLQYMPVEDKRGNLVGIIIASQLIDMLLEDREKKRTRDRLVKDVMITDPICVSPDEPIANAISLMKTHKIGGLPVTSGKELVGLLTEHNVIRVTDSMMKR